MILTQPKDFLHTAESRILVEHFKVFNWPNQLYGATSKAKEVTHITLTLWNAKCLYFVRSCLPRNPI